MGRTLELFELESNPAGEIKCNHVKGTVVSPGPARNYPKVLERADWWRLTLYCDKHNHPDNDDTLGRNYP